MSIVAPATTSPKLRRSGMNGVGDIVLPGSDSCRSYGAWPGVLATTTLNMALLMELGLPPAEELPFKVQIKLRALQTYRVASHRRPNEPAA